MNMNMNYDISELKNIFHWEPSKKVSHTNASHWLGYRGI